MAGRVLAAVLVCIFMLLGMTVEINEPEYGIPTVLEGIVVCEYPSDLMVLRLLTIASFTASVVVGFYSVFCPCKGKSVPRNALFRCTPFCVFFQITMWMSLVAQEMLVWVTMTVHIRMTRDVDYNIGSGCPTVGSGGLFGVATFLASYACISWSICLMLANYARDVYLDEEFRKRKYGKVLTAD